MHLSCTFDSHLEPISGDLYLTAAEHRLNGASEKVIPHPNVDRGKIHIVQRQVQPNLQTVRVAGVDRRSAVVTYVTEARRGWVEGSVGPGGWREKR